MLGGLHTARSSQGASLRAWALRKKFSVAALVLAADWLLEIFEL